MKDKTMLNKIIDVLSDKRTFDNESINLLNAHHHELVDNHYLVDNYHVPKTEHAQIVNTSLQVHAIRVSGDEHYIIDTPERFVKILKIKCQRDQLYLDRPDGLDTIITNAYLAVKRDLIRNVMEQNHHHRGMSMYLAKHLPYDTLAYLTDHEDHDRHLMHKADANDLCQIQQQTGKSAKEILKSYVKQIKANMETDGFKID